MGAKPDLLSPNNKDRKIYIKWVVFVDACPPGATFDDGSVFDGWWVLRVDIVTGEVTE